MMVKTTVLMLLTAMVAASSFAEPAIVAVDGIVQQGETLIIQGSGFGFKETAAPVWYDDFEGGSVGDPLMTSEDGWQEGMHLPSYSDRFQYVPGDVTCLQSFGSGETSFQKRSNMQLVNPTLNQVYFQGRLRIHRPDLESEALPRLVWLLGHWDEALSTPAGFRAYPNEGLDVGRLYSTLCGGDDHAVQAHGYGLPSFWGWHSVEFWHGFDQAGETEIMFLRVDGRKVLEGAFENPDCGLSVFSILPYFDDPLEQASLDFYWSSVYIDNTLARVEIGNHQTYEECTVREIQVPQAWSERQVAIQANLGNFQQGEAFYLFVMDQAGAVNAHGWPMWDSENCPGPPLNVSLGN